MAKKVQQKIDKPAESKTKKSDIKTKKEVIESKGLTTPTPSRTISNITIDELIAYEKASALVCGKYEVKARLSGIDQARFIEFSALHAKILDEMEKRVIEICSK